MKSLVITVLMILPNVCWAADSTWKPLTEEEVQANLDKLSKPDRWEYRVSKDGVITRVTPTPATEGPDIEWVKQFRKNRIEAGNPREPLRVYYFNVQPGTGSLPDKHQPLPKQTNPSLLPPYPKNGDSSNKPSATTTADASATQNTKAPKTTAVEQKGIRRAGGDGEAPAGTPEKDKPAEKTPDKGKDDDKKDGDKGEQKEPNWPPKEEQKPVESAYPTDEEVAQVVKLFQDAKNSGDRAKKTEATTQTYRLIDRLASGTNLTTAEWGKRYEAFDKLAEKIKTAQGYNTIGNFRLNDALAEDFGRTDGHANLFAKLKWMQTNAGKYHIDMKKVRIAVYKYIENNAEKFKDNAAKQLFCQQLIKGGINDQGLKELSESFK